MKTKEWRFDSDYNRITAIEPGNCRITIVDKIYGVDENDWFQNGKLIAMAPRMAELAHLILEIATDETDEKVLSEAKKIVNELKVGV